MFATIQMFTQQHSNNNHMPLSGGQHQRCHMVLQKTILINVHNGLLTFEKKYQGANLVRQISGGAKAEQQLKNGNTTGKSGQQ
jgi:hypothetical protein